MRRQGVLNSSQPVGTEVAVEVRRWNLNLTLHFARVYFSIGGGMLKPKCV